MQSLLILALFSSSLRKEAAGNQDIAYKTPVHQDIMPVMLRLARHGCTNRPFFHLVAIHNKFARNSGRALEQLGTFDPMPNNHNEKLVSLNVERIKYWLAIGAHPTPPVSHLLGRILSFNTFLYLWCHNWIAPYNFFHYTFFLISCFSLPFFPNGRFLL